MCAAGEIFMRIARDRSTTVRDTQWVRLGNVPSRWSRPCVLAFELHPSSLTILDTLGGCKKSALPHAQVISESRESTFLLGNIINEV